MPLRSALPLLRSALPPSRSALPSPRSALTVHASCSAPCTPPRSALPPLRSALPSPRSALTVHASCSAPRTPPPPGRSVLFAKFSVYPSIHLLSSSFLWLFASYSQSFITKTLDKTEKTGKICICQQYLQKCYIFIFCVKILLLSCIVLVHIVSWRSVTGQLTESEVDDLMQKERTIRHMINLSFTAALTLGASITAMAGQVHGNVDEIQEDAISGWAWDEETPEETPEVSVAIADSTGAIVQEASGVADIQRDDVAACGYGSGLCGFSIPLDWSSLPDGTYTVRTTVDGQPVGNDRPYYKGVPPIRSMGIFKTTGYCQCRSCSAGWGRLTSTGTVARPHDRRGSPGDPLRDQGDDQRQYLHSRGLWRRRPGRSYRHLLQYPQRSPQPGSTIRGGLSRWRVTEKDDGDKAGTTGALKDRAPGQKRRGRRKM